MSSCLDNSLETPLEVCVATILVTGQVTSQYPECLRCGGMVLPRCCTAHVDSSLSMISFVYHDHGPSEYTSDLTVKSVRYLMYLTLLAKSRDASENAPSYVLACCQYKALHAHFLGTYPLRVSPRNGSPRHIDEDSESCEHKFV